MFGLKKESAAEYISRTGFFVSVVSYLSFWFADTLRPGFVARYFSVHVFLISILVFGVWWSRSVDSYVDRLSMQRIAAVIIGIVLAYITWTTGKGLVGLRFLMVVLALMTPTIILKLIRNK